MRETGGQIGLMLPANATPSGSATAMLAVRSWRHREEDVDVDTTAAGDLCVDETSLGRIRFEGEGVCLVEIPSGTDPYDVRQALVGERVAFALKIDAADSTGFVSGTAKIKSLEIRAVYTEAMECTYTYGPCGTRPVWDLTPN